MRNDIKKRMGLGIAAVAVCGMAGGTLVGCGGNTSDQDAKIEEAQQTANEAKQIAEETAQDVKDIKELLVSQTIQDARDEGWNVDENSASNVAETTVPQKNESDAAPTAQTTNSKIGETVTFRVMTGIRPSWVGYPEDTPSNYSSCPDLYKNIYCKWVTDDTFDFLTNSGTHINGRFTTEWDDMCEQYNVKLWTDDGREVVYAARQGTCWWHKDTDMSEPNGI